MRWRDAGEVMLTLGLIVLAWLTIITVAVAGVFLVWWWLR